jgi:hypothetical protein
VPSTADAGEQREEDLTDLQVTCTCCSGHL